MASLKNLKTSFEAHATFLFVYIAEAHATNEWPVGDNLITGRTVLQPTTLAERNAEAQHFVEYFDLDWPVAVDDPSENAFLKAYAPWPTRYYIIVDGTMRFIADPEDDHTYDVGALRRALEEIVS